MRIIPWSNTREITTKQKVVPTLRITNDARSKVFYGDGLGSQVEWEHRFTPQLERVDEAYQHMMSGTARFRVVLTPETQ
jgi:D-arabinose 1-dehydrogenase-like Zn-dependent alcohol dehydrogenase